MTIDREKADRRKRLSLLSQEDLERIDLDRALSEPSPPTGLVDNPPPYHPGPRRKLPSWAMHLRELRPLRLVE